MLKQVKIKNRQFMWGAQTYVMAVINVTPDSFSGDGLLGADGALDLARIGEVAAQHEADGADIVDVGGVSSRPRHVYGAAAPVSTEEELRRVVPVVAELAKQLSVPISVDTASAFVARAALDSGADMINLVARQPQPVLAVAADYKCPVVLTATGEVTNRADVVAEVTAELARLKQQATAQGVLADSIILDPGIGYSKDGALSTRLLRNLGQLKAELDTPLLVGVSRKKFTKLGLDLSNAQNLGPNIAAAVIAIAGGADIIRTHDTEASKLAFNMADKILRDG